MSGLVSVLVMGVVLTAAGAVAVRADRRVAIVVSALAERPSSGAAWPARTVLEGLGRTRPGRRVPRDEGLARRLELAGSRWSLDALAGLKLALGFALGGLGVLLGLAMPVAGLAIPVLAVAGYRGPDLALARKGRRRQAEIELRVPDLVELLVATTEAGLTPAVAFHRSSEVVGGPLGDELGRAVAEIELGLSWRAAMERLVERTDVASLRRLVSAVGRSNRLGTSVQATLRSVAGDLRAERRARAEELARRAPVKMLFPLVLTRFQFVLQERLGGDGGVTGFASPEDARLQAPHSHRPPRFRRAVPASRRRHYPSTPRWSPGSVGRLRRAFRWRR